MTNDDNVIALPVKPSTKPEPMNLNLHDYAERLAAAIGWHVVKRVIDEDAPPWISKEPMTYVPLTRRANIPTLVIRQETWTKAKKIVITVSWPSSDATNGVCAPSGGDAKIESRVDPRRSMTDVASAVRRRMLPMYLARHAECMAKIAEWEAHRDQGDGVARRIQEACGLRSLDQRGEVRKNFYVDSGDSAAGAHVQVSGESVAMQITGLTEAQALRILEIVRKG